MASKIIHYGTLPKVLILFQTHKCFEQEKITLSKGVCGHDTNKAYKHLNGIRKTLPPAPMPPHFPKIGDKKELHDK